MPTGDPRDVMARPARKPDVVLRYAEHVDGVVDVRLPALTDNYRADRPRTPVVVLFHGGFWRAKWDRVHIRPLADALAELGCLVLTPEYRRIGRPGGGWPGTFDDVAAALDAVPRLLDGLVHDPADGATLVGHSAGGHLALWGAGRHRLPVTSRWRTAASGAITGVLGLAPVSDVSWAAHAGLDDGAAMELVGGSPEEEPGRYAQLDPTLLLPLDVRIALVHGTDDEQVPLGMSQRLAAAAQTAGDLVRLSVLNHTEHFALIDPLSAAWPDVRAALAWTIDGSAAGRRL